VSQVAEELGASQWLVARALAEPGIRLLPRQARLAQQRQRAAEERVAARIGALGFAEVRAYLVDRVVE
jgi:hypothetical protein